MAIEKILANFVIKTQYQEIPAPAVSVVRHILMTVLGTAVAGASEDGVQEALLVYATPAGNASARALVFGTAMPPASAATVGGLMARALDYCDAMAPGLHIGSSLIPAALAAVDMQGGCSGEKFLTALVVGAELASRMNLTEKAYAGLDPTGVAGIFGSTAAVSRILGLDEEQTLHALALAFNRCAGSFQSNIDGSLAVRMIQGWVAGDAVSCALLAKAGLTGPANFISGVYGFAKLYAKDIKFNERLTRKLGNEYQLLGTMFKKYPSCGMTQGATELILRLQSYMGFELDQISHVDVRVPGYGFRLVGHEFVIGDNPRVNAQFSLQYCIANALVRRGSTLDHFRPSNVLDPSVLNLCRQVRVFHDESLDAREHTSVALTVTMKNGEKFDDQLDIAPGFPGNSLTDQEHVGRFAACFAYAGRSEECMFKLKSCIESIEQFEDVRPLIDLTLMD
jgi:2-methylcitrate dehydratase PrpD